MSIKELIRSYFKNYSSIRKIAEKCLNTERWNGNVSLMVLDAAFTSVGVNYFQVVVPKIKRIEREFIMTGKIGCLKDLFHFNFFDAFHIWKNKRSWLVAKEIAQYLSTLSENDREALKKWAKNSSLLNWREDPLGRIKGVGLITYQYLRMMGGVDTVIPDRIVKNTINEILIKAGKKPIDDNMEFIRLLEKISEETGYMQTELCFMTWLESVPERIKNMP
ncbi:MAG: hypothetical protein RMI30_01005 [Thermodesulfovibrio sp.]|nr:hypothetical protein [Thermodesulfovibrio sp.]MDW7998022.1 hypothetical protein [Thermodesulfovibrio sp.]